MWIEIMEIIFSNLTWPLLILIFIIMYKKPIFGILQRLKTLKISGTVLETRIPVEQKTIKIKKSLPRPGSLSKEYAELLKKYKHEKIFNSIFGTQLDLLEHLSRRKTVGDKYINLRIFYDGYCRHLEMISSTAPPPMIKYLEFLEHSGFIEYVGEGDERIVKITKLGNDFLSYIKKQYPAEVKPYRYL